MPSAWTIADAVLQAQLQAYVDAIATGLDWAIDLYKNNHTPTAGDTEADYTAADFGGYAQDVLAVASFGTVTVTSHVAKSINAGMNTFTASNVATPQIVYGYFVTDDAGDLVFAEMFATAITVNPANAVNVTAELRHTTLPS